MKKNVMMRIAAVLLVCVLATTCGISGTFAKYVTKAEGSDSARVAKWGVEVTAQGPSNFNTEYKTHDTQNYSGGITVEAKEKVVAPGTSSDDVNGDTVFTLTGTPEVATRVTIAIADGFKDVYLLAGTYTDYTEHKYNEQTGEWYYETFTLQKNYYPIVWTLTLTNDADDTDGFTKSGTLAEIIDFLENTYAKDAEYAPNTDLKATFTLTWKWAFEHDGTADEKALYNAADTLLGMLTEDIKTETMDENEGYNTTISYDVTLTVTQID